MNGGEHKSWGWSFGRKNILLLALKFHIDPIWSQRAARILDEFMPPIACISFCEYRSCIKSRQNKNLNLDISFWVGCNLQRIPLVVLQQLFSIHFHLWSCKIVCDLPNSPAFFHYFLLSVNISLHLLSFVSSSHGGEDDFCTSSTYMDAFIDNIFGITPIHVMDSTYPDPYASFDGKGHGRFV